MLYKSYEDRARATSVLDTIFPIIPVDPQRLLYTILGVALPIPQLPADKVPPLYLPSNALPSGVKVDEESNATALGYVAMVISHLSLIMDKPLLYPVTCIGSRSLVRDYISVISGTRSFPLYAKGVERYRYDYAVFLLNKNIETVSPACHLFQVMLPLLNITISSRPAIADGRCQYQDRRYEAHFAKPQDIVTGGRFKHLTPSDNAQLSCLR